MHTQRRTRIALLGVVAALLGLTLPAGAQDTTAVAAWRRAAGEDDGGCPRATGTLKNVPKRALPQDSLLSRVRRVRAETKKNERTVAQIGLEQQMKGLDAGKLAALGAMLWVQGADNAAAHVLGAAIEKEPRDFLSWNNLGAVLNRLDKSEQAIPLLRHAVALNDSSALAPHNLGIAFAQVGARDSAIVYLERAIALDAKHLEANLARGQLEKCAKKPQQALRFLKAARKAGSSVRVEEEASEAEEQIAEEAERAGRPATPTADPPRPVSPAELPKAGWYVGPPIPDFDSATAIVEHGKIAELVRPLQEEGERLGQAASLVAMASPPPGVIPEGPLARLKLSSFKARTELWRSHVYYQAMLDSVLRHHEERVKPLHEQFKKEDDDLIAARLAHDEWRWEQFCSRWRALRARHYAPVAADARRTWVQMQKILEDWDVNSAYWVEQIRVSGEREYHGLQRRIYIGARYAWAYKAMGEAAEREAHPTFQCVGVPEPEFMVPELPLYQERSGDCPRSSTLSVDAVVISMRIDCKEISFKGGEGIIAEFMYNYRSHSGTFYAGVGASARVGAAGTSAGLGADMGVYVTYDERVESVTDIGLRATADFGISPNVNLPSVGTDVRIGLNSAF